MIGETWTHNSMSPLGADVLRSTGRPWDGATREAIETHVGHDVSDVRVHDDGVATVSSRAVDACAYTVGDLIASGIDEYRPQSQAWCSLLGHELTHVVLQAGQTAGPIRVEKDPTAEQQAGEAARSATSVHATANYMRNGRPVLQRAVQPKDVVAETNDKRFTLTALSGGLATGDVVTDGTWSNTATTVQVTLLPSKKAGPVALPERMLRPVYAAAVEVSSYCIGIEEQARAVSRNEMQFADWMALEPRYKSAKQTAEFTAEETSLEGLYFRRERALNRKLTKQTMFNRFDLAIKREVNAANCAPGLKDKNACDPNLLKFMLLQESQLGAFGVHLEIPPTLSVKTRFNLGQVIDSFAMAPLILIEREQSAMLTAYSLTTLDSDLVAAQRERHVLRAKTIGNVERDARLADLDRLSDASREVFIWKYRAQNTANGFAEAVTDIFAAPAPTENENYESWNHWAVMSLAHKRKTGRSLQESARVYNGSGAAAEHCRAAVEDRTRSAHGTEVIKTEPASENI